MVKTLNPLKFSQFLAIFSFNLGASFIKFTPRKMRISKFPIYFVGTVRKFAPKKKTVMDVFATVFFFFKFCGLETLAIFPIIWAFFFKLHFKRFSNFLFFQPQYHIFTKNQITSVVWIQFS